MNTFETLLVTVAQIEKIEQYYYTLGYINSEYAHNFITSKQYDTLFDLIQTKKERLV